MEKSGTNKTGATKTGTTMDRIDAAAPTMPPAIRRAGYGVLGVLTTGALYLVAVRRDAILTDLANFTAWCF